MTGFKAILKRNLIIERKLKIEINNFQGVRLELGSLPIILIGALIYFTCAKSREKLL